MKPKKTIRSVVILIILVIFISCSYKHIEKALCPMEKTKIMVVGIAHNSKAGAMILTDSNEVYYIAGLDDWKNKYYEKRVKVSGCLNTENFKEKDLKNEKGEWIQGMVGDKRTIFEAEWELVDE
ncbi:MAG: hypothetical protein ABFS35_02430 [Bacteroidota bacterium]